MSLTKSQMQNNEQNPEFQNTINQPEQNYNAQTSNNLYTSNFYQPKNYSQYHNFLNVASPVNRTLENKSYAVYYNRRGLLRDAHPLYSRHDLSKYLKNNGSLVKNNRRYYSNDKKNFDSNPYRTHDNCRFLCKGFSQDNPYMSQCEFPPIKPMFNDRYRNARNLKMKGYNLKNKNKFPTSYSTLNSYENVPNNLTVSGNEAFKKNNFEKGHETNFQTIKNETKDANKVSKRDQIINQFISNSATRSVGRRTFRKAQIFNNYKPFLVDNFRNYADYC